MERRAFLGLSVAALAALGSRTSEAQPAGTSLLSAVATLADLLDTGYVLPEIGKRYAAMLRAKLATGDYAGFTDPLALAARLTTDLAAVAPDRHLRVVRDEAPQGAPLGGPHPVQRRAIEDASWLRSDVAYIRFSAFPDDPQTATQCERFMHDHATAKSVIIDSRYNGGGGIVQMNAMLPFLYAKETTLVQMEMVDTVAKARGNPFEGDAFVRPAAGAAKGIIRNEHYVVPSKDETRLFAAKVFYLTSARTASAAEHLALAFRHTKRAVLIGETTAGANHFGGFEPIGAGLAVFLPAGRTIDPDTGQDWEGRGIAPDVTVDPTLALEEALRRSGALG